MSRNQVKYLIFKANAYLLHKQNYSPYYLAIIVLLALFGSLVTPANLVAQPRPMSDIEDNPISGELNHSTLLFITETRDQLKVQVDQENFFQAYPLALSLSDTLRAEYGEESEEYINSILDLALIQRSIELYEESNELLYEVLNYNFNKEGSFAYANVAPLQTMGANYNDLENYTAAFDIFEDARLITRRSLGLLNPIQLEIMRYQANLLLRSNQTDQGLALQNEAYRIARRMSNEDPDLRMNYLYEYAEWFIVSGQIPHGQSILIELIDMIREIEGSNSPNLVRAFRELGNSYRSYRRQRMDDQNGLGYLLRAERLMNRYDEPILSNIEKALVYRDLGDWHTAFSRVGDGMDSYNRAWAISLRDGVYPEEVKAWFEAPVAMITPRPNTRGLTNQDDERGLPGLVIADYIIDERGRTRNITIIESNPEGFKDGTVYASLRDKRYRPIMINGEAVATENLTETFSFYYLPTLAMQAVIQAN